MASDSHRGVGHVATFHEVAEDVAIVCPDVLSIRINGFDESAKHLTRIHKAVLDVLLDALHPFLPFREFGSNRSHESISSVYSDAVIDTADDFRFAPRARGGAQGLLAAVDCLRCAAFARFCAASAVAFSRAHFSASTVYSRSSGSCGARLACFKSFMRA